MTENRSSYSELKSKVSQWTKNIDSLKTQADRVSPHAKPEYERLVDLLVVKLSMLDEHMRKLKKDQGNSRRARTAIQKNFTRDGKGLHQSDVQDEIGV